MRKLVFGVAGAMLLAIVGWGHPAAAGPIHEAVKLGDVAQVEALLAAKTRITIGNTHYDSGINLDIYDIWGGTPLHYAMGDAVAKLLLAAGAKVDARDKDGGTPLHDASDGRVAPRSVSLPTQFTYNSAINRGHPSV